MRMGQRWSLPLVFAVMNALPSLAQQPQAPSEQPNPGWHRFGESQQGDAVPPPTLVLPAGTWITIRVDQPLSSDRNRPGDAFTGTLVQPLVASGRVIARPGQTVGGVVASAEKAGRVKDVSRLGVELNELSLADGRQVQVKTTLMEQRGNTSVGRDVGAVATSTGIGATIGAAADGGVGAGIGAIVGAAASTIGILATRGKPTVVYPEDQLTFRLEAPLFVSVDAMGDAFQPVRPEDYQQNRTLQRRPPSQGPPPPIYAGSPYPPYYGGYYGPYWYGPSVVVYSRPHYYYPHGGYHRHR